MYKKPVRISLLLGIVATVLLGTIFVAPSRAIEPTRELADSAQNGPRAPLNPAMRCRGENLEIDIAGGDGPFNIGGTGPGLPITGVGIFDTRTLTGPALWTDITITEMSGDGEIAQLGQIRCQLTTLTAIGLCLAANVQINIINGDGLYNVTGTGPGLPVNNVSSSSVTMIGPGTWTGVTVTESVGDGESLNLGDFSCNATTLTVDGGGCTGRDLAITVLAADEPLSITGTGPGLPLLNATLGIHIFTGPAVWTNVQVSETTGNMETQFLGDFQCGGTPLVAQVSCLYDPNIFQLSISSGDYPFVISGLDQVTYDPYPQNNLPIIILRYGPQTWNITVTESVGDHESIAFSITCPPPTVTPTPTPEILPPPTAEPEPLLIPNLRMVRVEAGQELVLYDRPAGDLIHLSDGSLLRLPQDSDGNGFDTYVVLDMAYDEYGDLWFGLNLGGQDLGWVKADSVIWLPLFAWPG